MVSLWIFIKEQSSIGSKTNGISAIRDEYAFGICLQFVDKRAAADRRTRHGEPNQRQWKPEVAAAGTDRVK
jgi:hypothetical protein